MKLSRALSRVILYFIAFLSIAFIICFSLSPQYAFSEEARSTAAEQVDEILKQIDSEKSFEKLLDASAKLCSMGDEIIPLLLQKLRQIDITKVSNPYKTSVTIASILELRGYDKDVFEILKSRLQSKDPEDRLSAAIMVAVCYQYYAVRDLAGIVRGENDPGYLNEQVMYEWDASSAEVAQQVLEVMQGKSDLAKRLVISLLKTRGTECPDCGDDVEKWKSFFKQKKNLRYLGSDWFDDRDPRHGYRGIRHLTLSPDGTKIAFIWGYVSEKKLRRDLWIMDTSTKRITKVRIPGNNSGPIWSPQGDKILFTNITSKGFNICTIREDGNEFCIWTKSFHSYNDFKAVWSHDSSKIAFVRAWSLPLTHEIWAVDLVRNNTSRVARDSFCKFLSSRLYPTWFLSEDDRIFFWDCNGEDKTSLGLYSVPLDSPEKREFVEAFDLDKSIDNLLPSPDETKLAYTKDHFSLLIYDSATKETREYAVGYIGNCAWTPDGKSIVYQRNIPKGGKSEIRILSLETGKSTKLANGFSLPEQAFAPGGNAVYYLKRDRVGKQASIWCIDLDGNNDTKIFPVRGIKYASVQPTPILKWAERN